MKISSLVLFFFVVILSYSCSSKKAEKNGSMPEGIEMVADDLSNSETLGDIPAASENGLMQEMKMEGAGESEVTAAPMMTGDVAEYVVQKNETLMMVAFRLYGDYRRWKEIAQLNNLSNGSIRSGMKIKYNVPAQEFVWNPTGNPYLIVEGDTLGKISDKVYGSIKKWKSIWDNNKALIINPNVIFSGFTIYYLPENDNQLATQ